MLLGQEEFDSVVSAVGLGGFHRASKNFVDMLSVFH
jgi:hypothetical protein